MIQEIITYTVVALAFAYAIYSAVNIFIPSKKSKAGMCASGCSGCSVHKDFKKGQKFDFVKK